MNSFFATYYIGIRAIILIRLFPEICETHSKKKSSLCNLLFEIFSLIFSGRIFKNDHR